MIPTNIDIKKVTLAEITLLQAIGRQTFFETFAPNNTEANMKKYLEEGFSLDKLTAELTNNHSAFYFAWRGDEVVGYLKVNFGQSQTELKDDTALEIERIYVLQAYHGQKVGQLLYDKAIAIARQAKVAFVWLGVWEKNTRALRFYQKNGFVEFDKHIFKLGDEEQTDLMMRLDL